MTALSLKYCLKNFSQNKINLQSIPRMVSVSDFQRNARAILAQLDDTEPTLILNRNHTVGVVLKPSVYEALMDELEDMYIGERLEKLVKESTESDFEPWEKLEQKLVKAGKLKFIK